MSVDVRGPQLQTLLFLSNTTPWIVTKIKYIHCTCHWAILNTKIAFVRKSIDAFFVYSTPRRTLRFQNQLTLIKQITRRRNVFALCGGITGIMKTRVLASIIFEIWCYLWFVYVRDRDRPIHDENNSCRGSKFNQTLYSFIRNTFGFSTLCLRRPGLGLNGSSDRRGGCKRSKGNRCLRRAALK